MEPSKRAAGEAFRSSAHARNVAGGIVGNVIEWYDFALFGFLAPVLSELFFPADNLLAGLVKTCLSLYQEILPPLRNFAHPLAELSVTGHRLNPSPHPQFWLGNREEGPHRAGLSAFSLDGNCTHVVLESHEHETEPTV